MKSEVTCKFCKQALGKVHGNQESELLRDHIKAEHPGVYDILKNYYRMERYSIEKFGVYPRDWYHYD